MHSLNPVLGGTDVHLMIKASWLLPSLAGHEANVPAAIDGLPGLPAFVGRVWHDVSGSVAVTRPALRSGEQVPGDQLQLDLVAYRSRLGRTTQNRT